MNKILFARLVNFITCIGNNAVMDHNDLEALDAILNTSTGEVRVSEVRINTLLDAMRRDEKIPAIKAYRELTGTGLKESKDAVEKYWVNNRVVTPASN